MDPLILALLAALVGALGTEGIRFLFARLEEKRSKKSQLGFKRCTDVIHWGWSGERLLKELIKLDYELIGDVLEESREGTAEQWAPVFMDNPDTWVLVTKGSRSIVGYWHFAPLSDRLFERVKSGTLLDSEVVASEVQLLDIPGFYNAYFTMIGADKKLRVVGFKLIDAFFDTMEALAIRGVFFKELAANAFTPDGARLCTGFGMKKIADHSDFGDVYALPMHPWPTSLESDRLKRLKSLYEAGFAKHSKP